MFKLFTLLLYGVLGFVFVLFILSNREPVVLALFPFSGNVEIPVYAALAIMFSAGLLIGLCYSASVSLHHYGEKRRLRKQLSSYQKAHDSH
jgi:uncharacterized integral membrane protein